MKKVLIILSILFGGISICLYLLSLRVFEGLAVTLANIPFTVYSAATAVMCIVCVAGALVIHSIEENRIAMIQFLQKSNTENGIEGAESKQPIATQKWVCLNCGSINPHYTMVCKKCKQDRPE